MTNTSPMLRDSDKEFIKLVYKGLPNAKRDVRRLKLRDAGPTGFGLLYGGGLRGGSLRDKGTPTGRNIRAILKRKEYEDMLARIENKYPDMSLEDIAKEEGLEVGIKKRIPMDNP